MRSLVACLAVVVAIALPGVIVAATASSPNPSQRVADYGPRAQIVLGQAPSASLMAMSVQVEAALEAKGMNTQLVGEGPDETQLIEERGGSCPAKVTFHKETGVIFSYVDSCGRGEFMHDFVDIVYSPRSIGPTVRRAVANLR
jgi:hypothetical protein